MNHSQTIYVVAQLEVLNFDDFLNDYAELIPEINQKYGVEVLAATDETSVIEGSHEQNFTVILQFPSAETLKAWYTDQDYQLLIKRRREITNVNKSLMLAVPAFNGKIK